MVRKALDVDRSHVQMVDGAVRYWSWRLDRDKVEDTRIILRSKMVVSPTQKGPIVQSCSWNVVNCTHTAIDTEIQRVKIPIEELF